MKFKLLILTMVLALGVWAQDSPSTSTPNATPAHEGMSCCHHAANSADAKGCCHHAKGDAKDASDCCASGKCDMKNAKCCSDKDMKKCMKACKKNDGCAEGKCCGAVGEKSAMNCCGTKCEHHQHAASVS